MAAQILKGHTYNPGDVVDAADLNALVDSAIARTTAGIITEQTAMVGQAAAGDDVLIAQGGVLKKANVSQLALGVSSVDFTATPGTVFDDSVGDPTGDATITLGLANQGPGKVLAGPVSGSPTTPAFRVLSPADLPVATVSIALADIDWNLGSMFTKTLTGNITFAFSNASAGQTIRVRVVQDGAPGLRTVTWPAVPGVRWPGGTNPVMTTGAGRVDIYTFHFIGGLYYGTFDQDFLL